jgi:CDP-4-dehydro-6-deoxyglucose reductase
MPLPPVFDARLVSARMLSRSVRELVFERLDGEPLVFDAGQWVNLVLPIEAKGELDPKRSYSIASPPDGTARFAIAVTHVTGGPGSTFLHTLELGTVLKTIGPQGFFTRGKGSSAPALLVGTGTGVTPLRSMLRNAIDLGHTMPLWLLFGVRHESDVLYQEELDLLVKKHPNVRVFYTLSQPQPSWAGRHGYVQTHVKELWAELLSTSAPAEAPHVYVCGLHRMVGSVRDLLRKEMGIPREQVHSERYD